MDSLGLIEEWPVRNAAAAVLAPQGVVETRGPLEHVFDLASVTKPLTALVILVAVEEGLIELDEPAGPPRATVRHLLSHAAGLAPDQRRLMTEPGTRRIYSNAGYEILADLVATRAGMSFVEYFTEALVEPLGLVSTSLEGSAAFGARGSVADLLVVMAEVMRSDPVLLDRETMTEAVSPQFPDLPGILPGYGLQDPNTWGLGFEIRSTKHPHWTGSLNSPRTHGHFGRSGTFMWIDPDPGVGLVVLTDRRFGDWAYPRWPALADRVLDSLAAD